MIIVENNQSDPTNDKLLAGMFEARKKVFVDLLGWDVPVLAGRFEIDQFDNQHATYIVASDSDGTHRASARLLKTTRAHILGTLFPELCAGPVPVGPDVLEITRFCLDRSLGGLGRRQARNQLVSALVDFALAHGIGTYTGVAEMAWLQQILAFGWVCRPLGLPVQLGGRMTGALSIKVDQQTPELLARNGIWISEHCDGVDLRQAA